MTKIYLVRHAEAEGNLYRIAHGHYNGLITDWRGPKQIRALAQRFEGIRVDAVYSSDLYRTQTTAQAVYVPKHLPLHTSPAFREVHMGAWEGHTWQEVSRLWPEEFYHFNHRIDLWQPEGGENARQVLERYLPALEEVARAHDGETIALFSHGAALRIVLGTLQGQTLREVGTSSHGDNTAVSLLEYENGRFRVVFRDDNSHLTGSDELSIFAKQTWWKNEDAVEQGTEFAPMPDALRAQLGVPRPGEATLIRLGSEPVGALQSHTEGDAGWVDWYWLAPAWRGRRFGIPPMGQLVQRYRELGLPFLRLRCEDPALRPFFARLGFYDAADGVMEKDIRERIPQIITV